MIEHLGARVNDRELRLFSVACVRRAWHFAKDERLPALLETLEQVADGRESGRAQYMARVRSYSVAHHTPGLDDMQECLGFELWGALEKVIDRDLNDIGECAAAAFGYAAGRSRRRFASGKSAERRAQADVLREIVGNPFRPVVFDPAWRTSDVTALATGIYDARAFDQLPILADALQDAGCDSADLLNHLRDPDATHVRGCWALDLVLGKE